MAGLRVRESAAEGMEARTERLQSGAFDVWQGVEGGVLEVEGSGRQARDAAPVRSAGGKPRNN